MTRLPLALVFALPIVLLPRSAFAQTPPPPPTYPPLAVEQIRSNLFVAPDEKVTELDGAVAHVAGGYAGWLNEDTLFVDGAAYSVANRSDDFRLAYGGLVAGWTLIPVRRIQFGTRAPVGVGRARLGTDIEFARFGRGGRGTGVTPRESVQETVRCPVVHLTFG